MSKKHKPVGWQCPGCKVYYRPDIRECRCAVNGDKTPAERVVQDILKDWEDGQAITRIPKQWKDVLPPTTTPSIRIEKWGQGTYTLTCQCHRKQAETGVICYLHDVQAFNSGGAIEDSNTRFPNIRLTDTWIPMPKRDPNESVVITSPFMVWCGEQSEMTEAKWNQLRKRTNN